MDFKVFHNVYNQKIKRRGFFYFEILILILVNLPLQSRGMNAESAKLKNLDISIKIQWFFFFWSQNSEINATICYHCSFIKWYLYEWRWIFLFDNSFIFTCRKFLRGLDDGRSHIFLHGKKSSVFNETRKIFEFLS